MSRLRVDGVDVAFGSTTVVQGASLDVRSGEVVGLLGRSGCGKSTMLRAIAGLEPLAAGRVLLDDHDLAGAAPHRRGIGLLLQDGLLFPHLDVASNVAYGLRMAGRPADERRRRVSELLALVGLEGFGPRDVATLSGGQAQRVALARALAPAPAVLLLDEPFSALDAVVRRDLVDQVGVLVRRLGLTVLAVSHDRDEAFAWSDRVAVMAGGTIVREGTPAELLDEPGSPEAARLLGFTVLPAAALGMDVGGADELVAVPRSAFSWAAATDAGARGSRALPGTVTGRSTVGGAPAVVVVLGGDGPVAGTRIEVAGPWETAPPLGATVEVLVDPEAVRRLPVGSSAPPAVDGTAASGGASALR